MIAQVRLTPLLAALSLLVVAACSTTDTYEGHSNEAQSRLAQAYAKPQGPPPRQAVELDTGFFIPTLSELEKLNTELEPSWAQQWTEFSLNDYPLQKALRELLLPVGVSVRLLDQISVEEPLTLSFQGALTDALEQISLLTGLHVAASEHIVTLRRFEMAEFDVAFLAGSTSFFLGDEAANPQGQRQAGGALGGAQVPPVSEQSSQYLNFTSDDLSVWSDLDQALSLLLSSEGQVAINQSSTSVLVRDYPHHVEQVRAYLLQQNRRLTRQVAVDVQIIDVSFNDSQQAGIDWDLVYQATSGSGILNFASAFRGQAGAQARAPGMPAELSYLRQGGRFDGSQALIQALSQQGVVEVSTHPRVVSLNNQIAKIVLQDNATYLASAGSAATANVGSTDLLIPGVVTTGFELFVLPKVSHQQVVMQLSTSLSDLITIDQVSSGDTTIQTPHTNRKKFFMKAMVADGETLLISGLQNSKNQWREERNFFSVLLGGRREKSAQRSETLVLLTPRILPAAELL